MHPKLLQRVLFRYLNTWGHSDSITDLFALASLQQQQGALILNNEGKRKEMREHFMEKGFWKKKRRKEGGQWGNMEVEKFMDELKVRPVWLGSVYIGGDVDVCWRACWVQWHESVESYWDGCNLHFFFLLSFLLLHFSAPGSSISAHA